MSKSADMVTDMRARIDAVIAAHNAGSWSATTHYIGDRVSFLTGTAKASADDVDQLTRHTGTVERREVVSASPNASFGFVQYDIRDDASGDVFNVNSGRVRMLDDQSAPAPVESAPAAPAAPKMIIGQRFEVEAYAMRGTASRPSDVVTSHYRKINGNVYGFSRVKWSDGSTTLRAYQGRSTIVLHEWIVSA